MAVATQRAPLETEVQRDVIACYERVGCFVARTAQSYRRGGRRNPGTPGIPDLYVFPPSRVPMLSHGSRIPYERPHPWWHESKALRGTQTPEQIQWQEQCKRHGCVYVLGGVEAALEHLRALGLVR